MAFCDIQDVLNYIPKLSLDDASDVTTGSIQGMIDRRYAELLNIARYRAYTLPLTPSIPNSNIDNLLFQLNVQLPVADLIKRRSTDFNPFLYKKFQTHTNIAKKNFRLFELGYFDFAFSNTLPVDPMCTAQEVVVYIPGFTLEVEPTGGYGPSQDTIEKWIDSETAIIYAYASYLNYTTDLNSADTEQINIYKNIVTKKVASDLARSQTPVNDAALSDHANNLLEEYYELVTSLLNRDFDQIFL